MSSSMRASRIEHLVLVLRKVFADHVVAEAHGSGGGRFSAGEQLDERGFAGAVDADESHAVAALDGEAAVAEDVLGAVALREALGFHHHAAGGRRLRELEVDDRLFFRNLDALDLFELLDAPLHLLGLGGLVAEAVDEGFKMLDLVALVAVGGDAAARGARLSA